MQDQLKIPSPNALSVMSMNNQLFFFFFAFTYEHFGDNHLKSLSRQRNQQIETKYFEIIQKPFAISFICVYRQTTIGATVVIEQFTVFFSSVFQIAHRSFYNLFIYFYVSSYDEDDDDDDVMNVFC